MLHLNRVVTRSHASLCADSPRRWSEDEAISCLERCKMKSQSVKRRVSWKLFYLIIQKCLDENIFNKAFVQKGLGSLSFSRRLPVWDTFDCHMEDSVSKSLKENRVSTYSWRLDKILPSS